MSLEDYEIGREWRVLEFSIWVSDPYDDVLITETVDQGSEICCVIVIDVKPFEFW